MILENQKIAYQVRRNCQKIAFDILGPVNMAKIYFRIVMHRKLCLENPQYFMDKLNWYKLFYCPYSKLIVQCADKYGVREYLKKKGYEDYLIPLVGVWDTVEQIDYDKLPDKFVLKCNHGSGYNIVCDKKEELDWKLAQKILNKWMKEDFGKFNVEIHYDKIKKKILCEKYIESSDGICPTDYKIHCFNGIPRFIEVCKERKAGEVNLTYYDCEGNGISYGYNRPNKRVDISYENLIQMNDIAQNISKDFQYVRVDFYISGEKILIGELTFTSGAGLMNYFKLEADKEIGTFWKLSKNESIL